MNIKEKIINESLKKCGERIAFLKEEIFQNDPIRKQLDIHIKFNKFLEEKKGKERSTDESISYINKLSDEMDFHKKRAKTYNKDKLIEELINLQIQKQDLIIEQWQTRKRNNH